MIIFILWHNSIYQSNIIPVVKSTEYKEFLIKGTHENCFIPDIRSLSQIKADVNGTGLSTEFKF